MVEQDLNGHRFLISRIGLRVYIRKQVRAGLDTTRPRLLERRDKARTALLCKTWRSHSGAHGV